MMIDNAKYKIFFATLAILVTFFCSNFKTILNYYGAFESIINAGGAGRQINLEREIIKSWDSLINLPNRGLNRNLKIAIGLNTNVDLIVSGTQLINGLRIKGTNLAENHQIINDLKQFKECFKYYFQKGSAAERFFDNFNDFEIVLNATESLVHKQHFIGGNAALMAQGISKRFNDSDIILIGPIGPELKNLLNNNIHIPDDCIIDKDEIHLILEYTRNEKFEELLSPTSNRFIISHDRYNSKLDMIDEFFNITQTFKPDITILAGLHLLESQNETFRSDKLKSVKNYLMTQDLSENIVHLELASIADKSLMKTIIDYNILQEVNSLGLNEQELLFLTYSSGQGPHSLYYEQLKGQPELHRIIDILEWTLNSLGNDKSKLTRIHFHCLMYHIIAEQESSNWSNTASALLSGAKIAGKQACGFEYADNTINDKLENLIEFQTAHLVDKDNNILFEIEKNKFVKFNSSNPVIEFKRGNIRFYFTPVLVCKKPIKTVGLGDAISSNALYYNEYRHVDL